MNASNAWPAEKAQNEGSATTKAQPAHRRQTLGKVRLHRRLQALMKKVCHPRQRDRRLASRRGEERAGSSESSKAPWVQTWRHPRLAKCAHRPPFRWRLAAPTPLCFIARSKAQSEKTRRPLSALYLQAGRKRACKATRRTSLTTNCCAKLTIIGITDNDSRT